MNKVRIALADDHPPILDALKAALSAYGWLVVGVATDAGSVMQMCEQECPDILVLDVRFATGRDGLAIAREILELHPSTKVIFYSQFEDAVLVREAYQVGGSCYVLKSLPVERLVDVIERVAAGETFFIPEVLEPLAQLAVIGKKSPTDLLTPRDLLTNDEFQVFLLVAAGKEQPEIANVLGVSLKTVNKRNLTIKEKLAVSKPSEMTRLAMKHGYNLD